jgi:hypothetical protein
MRTGSLSRGQSGLGVALTTHLHIVPRLKKKYLYSASGSSWLVRASVDIYTGSNVTL